MEKQHKIQNLLQRVVLSLVFLGTSITTFAQAPGGVPYGNPEPVNFDLFNVILFIVIPILIIVTYFWYRRKKKKDNNE